MGVTYYHYFILKPYERRPESQQIIQLIDTLVINQWIPSTHSRFFHMNVENSLERRQPESYKNPISLPELRQRLEQHQQDDISLCWHIDHNDADPLLAVLKYPLIPPPDKLEYAYYWFYINMMHDYCQIEHEFIDNDTPLCPSCKTDLSYDSYSGTRVYKDCPQCGHPFPVSSDLATLATGWGEYRQPLREVVARYRFALVIDCHKSLPGVPASGEVAIHPELKALVESTLDQEGEGFGSLD